MNCHFSRFTKFKVYGKYVYLQKVILHTFHTLISNARSQITIIDMMPLASISTGGMWRNFTFKFNAILFSVVFTFFIVFAKNL